MVLNKLCKPQTQNHERDNIDNNMKNGHNFNEKNIAQNITPYKNGNYNDTMRFNKYSPEVSKVYTNRAYLENGNNINDMSFYPKSNNVSRSPKGYTAPTETFLRKYDHIDDFIPVDHTFKPKIDMGTVSTKLSLVWSKTRSDNFYKARLLIFNIFLHKKKFVIFKKFYYIWIKIYLKMMDV